MRVQVGLIVVCAQCGSMTRRGRHLDPELDRAGRFCDLVKLLIELRLRALR